MWQSERLQNGLQDSEGSGRPGKEDIRSPGENQKAPPENRKIWQRLVSKLFEKQDNFFQSLNSAQAAVAQTERELVKAEPLKISTVKVMIAPDRCLNSEVISDPTIYFRVA